MTWRIEVSAEAERDLDLLFDHLFENYVYFGETRKAAAAHAGKRVSGVLETMDRIATAPYRGDSHEEWLPGLRHLTLERSIYWYQILEATQTIRILAIFHGGQDHVRHMFVRLLSDRD